MDRELQQFLRERLEPVETSPGSKVMPLSEAVRRFVEPGMSLQSGSSMTFPTAIYYEIARQFWGSDPGFTLISTSGGAFSYGLFAFGRLCRRIISAFIGDGYPFPGPNPLLTRAISEGHVIPESWTYLTLTQRLIAGAMGVPFFPTKSLRGSSMERENQDAFRRTANPFDPEESVAVLRALNPDISLAHGWAADPEGNTILACPYNSNHYGALAARAGVIVTVERVVDADFIRRHSYLTRIPGHVVKAVCPTPFGGHPTGLHPLGVPEFDGYGEDEEFILEARQASRTADEYQAWVDKWVLGCRDHGDLVRRLGQQRVWFLMGRIHEDSWMSELGAHAERLGQPEQPTPAERMVMGAAHKLQEIVKSRGHQLVLCGIGVANLASWMACFELRKQSVPLELLAEIGFYGYLPQPADPFVFSLRNLPPSRMTCDVFTTLGIFVCGFENACIGVLGAGQVDRFGNVNTTKVAQQGPYLVGSGGGNDVASGAREVMITIVQSKGRFVEQVPYITSPGDRVTTVVSQYGIFEKLPGRHELELSACLADGSGTSEEEMVRTIRAECAWPLKIREPLQVIPPPSSEQLRFLRCFDPKRLFLGGSESRR